MSFDPISAAFDLGKTAIVSGMLGIGGMRSYDKLKGQQTDRIR
jgi:hypothetical protein